VSAQRIALYQPIDGELDPWPIVARLQRPRCWYLPVVRQHPKGRLWFVRYHPKRRLKPNRFGILEPSPRQARRITPQGLDLILVPLVGFDQQCHRLGMGAGFYDRSLAFLRSRRCWHRPRLIGIGHECQKVDALVPQPWDLPLDAVVTEAALYLREPHVLR
jgi:5-formyltetrahydrofolate cyclo-ligase